MTLVREADLTDLPFILPLSRDSFSPYGHYDLSIARWFLTPGACTFVCEKEANGKVCCGFRVVVEAPWLYPAGQKALRMEL